MSDIRLQNLLQSVKQTHSDHKEGHDARAARFEMKATVMPSALADFLANYKSTLAAQAEIIIEAKVLEVKNQEIGDKAERSSSQALIRIEGKNYLVPIPAAAQSTGATPIVAGDRFLIQPSPRNADNYLVFHLTDADQVSNAHTAAALPSEETFFNTQDVASAQKYADRVAQLSLLEAQIDALQKIIPHSASHKTALLRSFPVDLEAGGATIELPLISARHVLAPMVTAGVIPPIVMTEIEGGLDNTPFKGLLVVKPDQAHHTPPLFMPVQTARDQGAAMQVKSIDSPLLWSSASLLPVFTSLESAVSPSILLSGALSVSANLGSVSMQAFTSNGATQPLTQNQSIEPPRSSSVEAGSVIGVIAEGAAKPLIFAPQAQQPLPATHHDAFFQSIDALVVEKPNPESSAAYRSENLFMSAIVDLDDEVMNRQVLVNTGAGRLSAKIIGETSEGFKVAQPEWAGWPARSALILGQIGAADTGFIQSLSAGDVLNISFPVTLSGASGDGSIDAALLTSETASLGGAQGAQLSSQLMMPTHLMPFVQSSPMATEFVQALEALLAALMMPSAQLNPSPLQAVLPNMAKPAQLVPAMLFLLAAFRSGEVGGLVGDKGQDSLARQGKADLFSTLLKSTQNGSVALRSQPEQGSGGSEWRSALLPMQVDGQTQVIAMHWMDHNGGHNESGDEGEEKTARFILDFSLSSMGAAQIDGFYTNKRLDVALRLETLPSEAMRKRVQNFYLSALEQTDLTGDLRFQIISDKAVTFKAV